jgi:hypothetical protein
MHHFHRPRKKQYTFYQKSISEDATSSNRPSDHHEEVARFHFKRMKQAKIALSDISLKAQHFPSVRLGYDSLADVMGPGVPKVGSAAPLGGGEII